MNSSTDRALRSNAENWEGLAREDPFSAVLVDAERRHGAWTPEEFYAAGEQEIAIVERYLRDHDLLPPADASVLDFGCGAGRLTCALAQRFERCVGVDISPAMLELARRHSELPRERLEFVHNTTADLACFADDSFDFVYSSIVLQHVPPPAALAYVREFVRVTRPGGVLLFQQLDDLGRRRWKRVRRRLGLSRATVDRVLAALGLRERRYVMEMHGSREAAVRRVLEDTGAAVVEVCCTNAHRRGFNGDLRFLDREPERGVVAKQYLAVVGEELGT